MKNKTKSSKPDQPDAQPAPAAEGQDSSPADMTPGWALIQELNTDGRLRRELRELLNSPENLEL